MSDDKVNMSLDEIIKLQKKGKKTIGAASSSSRGAPRKVVRRSGASALQVKVRGRGGIAKKRAIGGTPARRVGGGGAKTASPRRVATFRRSNIGKSNAATAAAVANRQATKRLVQNLVKKALKRQTAHPLGQVLARPVPVQATTSSIVLGQRRRGRGGARGGVVNVASRAMARLSGVSLASRAIRRRPIVAPQTTAFTATGLGIRQKPMIRFTQRAAPVQMVQTVPVSTPRQQRQIITAPIQVVQAGAGPTRAERRAFARARAAAVAQSQPVVVVQQQRQRPVVAAQPRTIVIRRGGGARGPRLAQTVARPQPQIVYQAAGRAPRVQVQRVQPRVQYVPVQTRVGGSRQERDATLAAALNINPRRQAPVASVQRQSVQYVYQQPQQVLTIQRRGRGFRDQGFY